VSGRVNKYTAAHLHRTRARLVSGSPSERGCTGCRLDALIHQHGGDESLAPPNGYRKTQGRIKQRPLSFHSSKYNMSEERKYHILSMVVNSNIQISGLSVCFFVLFF